MNRKTYLKLDIPSKIFPSVSIINDPLPFELLTPRFTRWCCWQEERQSTNELQRLEESDWL